MKTESTDNFSFTQPNTAQAGTSSSEIDRLAHDIFVRLNTGDSKNAIDDLELQLSKAAGTLVPPSSAARAVVHASLLELPSRQRETLLLHLGGLTCSQIARSQGRAHDAALKDLSSAYARLRFSLEPIAGAGVPQDTPTP